MAEQRLKNLNSYYIKCLDIINLKLEEMLTRSVTEFGVNRNTLLCCVSDIQSFIRNDTYSNMNRILEDENKIEKRGKNA